MKIGIFGCGYIYNRYKHLLPKDLSVVAILDNDITNHGSKVDGIRLVYPREILSYEVDLIILMSDAAWEMREQLCMIGFDMSKVVHYRDYFGGLEQRRDIFPTNITQDPNAKGLLIISNELGYHGAPMTALGMVICARRIGYNVSVVAASGEKAFIDELNTAGANVIIQTWIEHASWDNLQWMCEYDEILVNSIPLIICAIRIAAHRRTLLWIHDSPEIYYSLRYWWEFIQSGVEEDNLTISAVSNRAAENFRRFFNYSKAVNILAPYVQDCSIENNSNPSSTMKFSVIGPLVEGKGQQILLKAIHSLPPMQDVKFFFVGKSNDTLLGKDILEKISDEKSCEYLGEMSRREIYSFFQSIDVVIVPSMEETLSLAAVEAMMMQKVCIVSDHCGIADFIRNGENGFVFPLHDTDALSKSIEWCVKHRQKCVEIGINARKTYEESFSLNVFENSFMKLIEGFTT